MTPFLLVLSSPSGGGKSTIARRLIAARTDVTYSVSATTRSPRGDERDGDAYHFLTRADFDARVAAGDFVEWADYGGNRYGTLRSEVERGLASGRHVVLDIEVQGAEQLRNCVPDAVHVFVLPPSAAALVGRLRNRQTDSAAAIERRFEIARRELALVSRYDYVVVNEAVDQAVAAVSTIIDAESQRVARQADLGLRLKNLERDLSAIVGAGPG